MRRALALLSLFVAVAALTPVLGAAPASAHASVSATEPKADSNLQELPRRVVVHVLKKQATRAGDPLQVFAPDGTRVDTADVLIGDAGATISVGIRPGTNAAGVYNVLYQITSADTHIIEDRFSFTLTPSGTGVLAPPVASDLRMGTAQRPAGRLRLTGPPAGSVIGAVLLVAALVVLVVMMRRRRRHEAAPEPERPGFRVITSGEHRLGHIPAHATAAAPRRDGAERWDDEPAWDGPDSQWAPPAPRPRPHPGYAPARADWGPQRPVNGSVPVGSHARSVR